MENFAISPLPAIRTSALLFQPPAPTSLLKSSIRATPGLTKRLTILKHGHWRACLLITSKLSLVRFLLKSTWRDQYSLRKAWPPTHWRRPSLGSQDGPKTRDREGEYVMARIEFMVLVASDGH